MNALLTTKVCGGCAEALPLERFYRTAKQIHTLCKRCHNARCVDRVRQSPARQAKQAVAKRAWTVRNPERKRWHEGRAVFLGNTQAPACLVALERLAVTLGGRP